MINSASHSAGTIILNSGIEVSFEEIWQIRTYAGVLIGRPTPEQVIETALALLPAKISGGSESAVVLFNAVRSVPRSPSRSPSNIKPTKKMPCITCAAVLCGPPPARNKDADYSVLTVLWFQNEWAFPIAKNVENRIRRLDWPRLAKDAQI